MPESREQEVTLEIVGGHIAATLTVPSEPRGIVIFAHGSGSSRHSPRNRLVARALQRSRMATLLLDLLTESEDARDRVTGEFRFDIILLAKRLVLARSWCAQREDLKPLPAGYFGASTGAAAALVAAAGRNDVEAIVSRGGRPDLAGVALADVRAATLLIVGERDETVLQLNRDAAAKMNAHNEIAIVPSATHLFEEPGALERVGELARAWFSRYLRF